MRHWIAGVPARAELALFAWEADCELRGWATAARNWWSSDPHGGILAITVDGSHRGEGIGTALAEAADEHLGRLGVRTTRAGSLDEPGARALAARRGFEEIAAATVSGVDPRTVEPRPIPAGVELVPWAEHGRPRPCPRAGPGALPRHPERGLRRDRARGVEGRVLAEPADRRRREPGGARRRAARRPDDDPHRPAQRPRAEQPLRRPAAVSRQRAGAPPQVPQPPSRRRARRDDRPHRQRRDERADAGGEQAARLRAVRPPSRVGAGCRYQRHGELDVRAEAGRAQPRGRCTCPPAVARTSPCSSTSPAAPSQGVVAVSSSGPPFGAFLPITKKLRPADRPRAKQDGEGRGLADDDAHLHRASRRDELLEVDRARARRPGHGEGERGDDESGAAAGRRMAEPPSDRRAQVGQRSC